jgi:hypothetical protein
MRVTLNLTKREAEVLLREGIDHPYGVRKSQARQTAEMKLIGAIAAAVKYADFPTTPTANAARKDSA